MAAAALVKKKFLGSQSLPENSPSGFKFLLLFKAGVTRYLLRDLEQKKVATPNQTYCNRVTSSPGGGQDL